MCSIQLFFAVQMPRDVCLPSGGKNFSFVFIFYIDGNLIPYDNSCPPRPQTIPTPLVIARRCLGTLTMGPSIEMPQIGLVNLRILSALIKIKRRSHLPPPPPPRPRFNFYAVVGWRAKGRAGQSLCRRRYANAAKRRWEAKGGSEE